MGVALLILRRHDKAWSRLQPYLPVLVFGALAGSLLPDLDVVAGAAWGLVARLPLEAAAKELHHTFTHSLLLLGGSLAITAILLLAAPIGKKGGRPGLAYLAGVGLAAGLAAALFHGFADLFWLDPVAALWPLGGRYHFGVSFTDEYARVLIMNVDLLLAAAVLAAFAWACRGRLPRWESAGLALAGAIDFVLFVGFVCLIPEYLANNPLVRYANFAALVMMILELLWLCYAYAFRALSPGKKDGAASGGAV